MTREEEIIQESINKFPRFAERRVGFVDGALWADKTMLDKACEWLENNLDCMASMTPDGEMYWLPNCIDNFRKAMGYESKS